MLSDDVRAAERERLACREIVASLEKQLVALREKQVNLHEQPATSACDLLRTFRSIRNLIVDAPTGRGATILRSPFAHFVAEVPLTIASSLTPDEYRQYGRCQAEWCLPFVAESRRTCRNLWRWLARAAGPRLRCQRRSCL